MKHRLIVLATSVWCVLASTDAAGVTLACPSLAQARPVGACPSEEELRYTFTGYCSDDNKAYRGETDVCTDYQRYRALKNVALWESGDGNFDGYLSCSASPRERQKAVAQSMDLVLQGKLTKLVCSYSNNQSLTHRTRAQCKVEVKDCGPDGSACRASCD